MPKDPPLISRLPYWAVVSLPAAVAALTAAIPLAALYRLSWRAQTPLGHWPRLSADDPKYIGRHDPIYQTLSGMVEPAFQVSLWLLMAWAVLMFVLRRRLSLRGKAAQVALVVASYVVLCWEPGQRFAWWID